MGMVRGPDDLAVSDMAMYLHRAISAVEGTYPRDAAFQAQGEVILIVAARAWFGGQVAWLHMAAAAVAAAAVPRAAGLLGLGARGRVCVGVVAATWFPSAMYAQLYLGESVAASLTLIAAVGWLAAFSGDDTPAWHQSVAGVALGTACLFRPNLQLTALVAVAWVLWAGRRAHAAAFSCGVAVGLLFAHRLTHALVPSARGLAENGGFNFYMSVAPIRQLVSTTAGGGWVPVVNARLYSEAVTTDIPLTDSSYFYAEAWRLIAADPGAAVARWAMNLWCSAGSVMTFPGFDGRGGDAVLMICAAVSAIATVASIASFHRGTAAQKAMAVMALPSVFVTCAFFMGTPRARYPFDVIVLLVGATQVGRAVEHYRRWRTSRQRAA